jgi:hypothetical protein
VKDPESLYQSPLEKKICLWVMIKLESALRRNKDTQLVPLWLQPAAIFKKLSFAKTPKSDRDNAAFLLNFAF